MWLQGARYAGPCGAPAGQPRHRRGILALAFSHESGPVNIGNPDELSMRRLAEWIKELTRSDWGIEYIDLPVDDPKVRRPDTTWAKHR